VYHQKFLPREAGKPGAGYDEDEYEGPLGIARAVGNAIYGG